MLVVKLAAYLQIETQESDMKHGARNDIVGEVVEIKSGDLMSQTKVKIDGEFDLSSVRQLIHFPRWELKRATKYVS